MILWVQYANRTYCPALIQERDRLNRAIEALNGSTGKRRGRPPKSAVVAVVGHDGPFPMTPKKRAWSAAQKKAAALRMKARWAKKKKAAK
jgi:hypothetical protein